MAKPNFLQLRGMAALVEQFDPEPWRTHLGAPPTPPPEDHETKVAGMAEILRNEDSYKDDQDLQGLSDEALLFLWAFKTSDKIDCEIVYP